MSSQKLLFVCTANPLSSSNGASKRTAQVLRILRTLHEVTVVAATERPWPSEDIAYAEKHLGLQLYCLYKQTPIRTVGERFRKEFDSRFLNTNGVAVNEPDRRAFDVLRQSSPLLWVHTLKLANAFRLYRWPNSIVDVDDYPSRFHISAALHARSPRVILNRLRLHVAWKRREKRCVERFSGLVVCKQSDLSAFKNHPNVSVVANSVSTPHDPQNQPKERYFRLGMLGDFSYLPNIDGLRWFSKRVLPILRAGNPRFEIRLVGKGSDTLQGISSIPEITRLGFVEDLSTEMATWSAMVVPTRLGGGTHLKVAEALARGVPIVSTTHGLRGYYIEDNVHALRVDSPEDFAQACIGSLSKPKETAAIGAGGRKYFEAHLSETAIRGQVQAVLSSLRP